MINGDELAARIRKLLSGPRVTEKRMFGGICFLFDGNMMLAASQRGLLVRVGKDGQDAALMKPGVRPMEQSRRSIPGYVVVAGDAIVREADLKAWIDIARAHVATIPPKAGSKASKRRSARRAPRAGAAARG
jgi:TfoX/Sxy family transcriptional regulator of competence genes